MWLDSFERRDRLHAELWAQHRRIAKAASRAAHAGDLPRWRRLAALAAARFDECLAALGAGDDDLAAGDLDADD